MKPLGYERGHNFDTFHRATRGKENQRVRQEVQKEIDEMNQAPKDSDSKSRI